MGETSTLSHAAQHIGVQQDHVATICKVLADAPEFRNGSRTRSPVISSTPATPPFESRQSRIDDTRDALLPSASLTVLPQDGKSLAGSVVRLFDGAQSIDSDRVA